MGFFQKCLGFYPIHPLNFTFKDHQAVKKSIGTQPFKTVPTFDFDSVELSKVKDTRGNL